jgi:ParB/RepB/Spo0J family partition protein
MTHSQSKRGPKTRGQITLSASRDIPFDKLVLSQSNVRRIKAGVSIEELAADIARRTLLQSLTVRPVLDEHGTGTGMFEIPAGGRRYRALELLVQRKQLARTAPVPCVIRTEGLAEEDSLAENVQRAPLHPLDQFRAFLAMREKGMGEEEIAAAFFVSSNVVRQRLRMAAVSPALLEVYAEDGMSLEQLMAFTLNPDHARQDQVWEAIQQSWSKEPFHIRRLLTEHTVRADDKRAQFIGADAYEAAGGVILRDLFQTDHGGFLQDASLLDRMVAQKLDSEADALRGEGWKWIELAVDFPYGHTFGLRRLMGEAMPPDEAEQAAYEALKAEFAQIEFEQEGVDDLPDDVDARLGEIETAMEAFQNRPVIYDDEEKARAGVFVSVDGSGIHVESAGDASAVSPAGAMGLMQIMPGTWADLPKRYRLGTDPFDPHDNIFAGTAYLREMYDQFGSPGFLAAYNAGPGRYAEHLATGRRLPRETQAYVAKLVELLRFETSQLTGIAASERADWRNAGLFVPPVNSIAEVPTRHSPANLIDDYLAATPPVPEPFVGRNPGLFVLPLTAEEAP